MEEGGCLNHGSHGLRGLRGLRGKEGLFRRDGMEGWQFGIFKMHN